MAWEGLNRKKITFIYPGISYCGFNSFGKSGNPEANLINHGIALLSSYLESSGFATDLIDMRSLKGWGALENEIARRSPGCFGISAVSSEFGIARKAATLIKSINPGSVVFAGGVHPTICPEEAGSCGCFDSIFLGESETALVKAMREFGEGKPLQRVYSGSPFDLDKMPWANRELFSYSRGELLSPFLSYLPKPFVTLLVSRGCPFSCTFCQPAERRIFNNTVRIRSAENVIAEMEHLRSRYAFRSFMIHDDLFLLNSDYIKRFIDLYRKNGFKAAFACQARSDIICRNKEMIRELKSIGLSCLIIGFESGSQKVLDFIKKGVKVEENYEAADFCRREGIKIFANIMYGLPAETAADVISTVKFVRRIKPDFFSPSIFTPYPGTEIFEYCKSNKALLVHSYYGFRRAPNSGKKIKGVNYPFINLAILFSYAPLFPVRGLMFYVMFIKQLIMGRFRARE